MSKVSRWLPLVLFLAPLAWLFTLALRPLGVAFQPGSEFTDLALTHWPNALLINRSLQEWGAVPLWNPFILGGTPFAANPLSGLWYPPLWLAALFPAPVTFNVLLALHLGWAGLGAYRLAREEGLGLSAAMAAGLVFGGLPKLVAHIASGHVTLVMAVAWTGWLLLLAGRAAISLRLREAALAGLVLGVIMMADPRWALPAAVLGAAYAIWHGGRRLLGRRGLAVGLVGIVFAAGASAALTLPLSEFIGLSSRATLSPKELLEFSLPPSNLLALVFPQAGSYAELTVYVGMVALALAALGLNIRRGRLFWGTTLVLAVLLALGGYTSLYPALARVVPGLSLLRVPSRLMIVAGLAAAMLAARGVEALHGSGGFRPRTSRLAATALAAAGAVLVGGAWLFHWPESLCRAGAGLTLIGVIFAACSVPRLGHRWAAVLALAFVTVDLALYDATLIEGRPWQDVAAHGEPVAAAVAQDQSLYRVYSPSYSLPQPAAVLHGVQLLDGVDPMQLAATVNRVQAAGGVVGQGYSVTLPPFRNGDPARDNRDAIPSAELLGRLNVGFIAAEFPLEAEGLALERTVGTTYLYRNERALPRAWMAASPEEWAKPLHAQSVKVTRYTANEIELLAEGPGLLVLSEAAYPGWKATADGEPASLISVDGWFRAVRLAPGSHIIEVRYAPARIWIGLAITTVTLLAFLGIRRWTA